MKRRDKTTEAGKVSSKRPNNPPPTDGMATAGKPRTKPVRRGSDGRFTAKSKGGAPLGNSNATSHGGRKQRTSRGAIKHPDGAVRRGRERANRFWRDTNCHPKDARKQTLAILESECLRCEDQMGDDYKPHNRDLTVKELTLRYDRLVERRDALWAELRAMYCPVLIKPVERRHVFVCRFSTGEAVFHSPTAAGTDEHTLCEQDKALATECLEGADVAATDEHVEIWWLGRLWNGFGDRVARFGDGVNDGQGAIAMRISELGTEVAPSPQADAAAPDAAEPDAESVSALTPEPAPAGVGSSPIGDTILDTQTAQAQPPDPVDAPAKPEPDPIEAEKQRQRDIQTAAMKRAAASDNTIPFPGERYYGSAQFRKDRDMR